jgi:4-amino-4-deoxy-L-arabinose transferase-like glycosyltransferase
MPDERPAARDWLLVLAVATALRLLGAWSIPLGRNATMGACAPDEIAHFEATAALAAGDARTFPQVGSIYTVYPPSQYAAQALALAAAPSLRGSRWLQRSAPEDSRYIGYGLARLGSVALGVASVALLMGAAQRATGSREVALAIGLTAAAYPQLAFVASYVNGDAMTLAASAFLVFALAGWARRGEGDAGLAAIGLAAGLVLLGKPYGYAALVPAAGWIAWAVWRRSAKVRRALGAAALALIVSAPVLAWNAARNGGDALGLVKYSEFISHPGFGHPGAFTAGYVSAFLRTTAISSFAKLGNMSIALPLVFYPPWMALVACGGVTLVTLARRPAGVVQRSARALLATSGLGVALLAWNSWRFDFQPQGRYVLVPAFLLSVLPLAVPPGGLAAQRHRAWRLAWVAYFLVAGLWAAAILYLDPCGD